MEKFNEIKIFFYENKNKIITLSLLLLISIIVTMVILNRRSFQNEKIVLDDLTLNNSEASESETKENFDIDYLYVDIKGEVNVPGVYSLPKGKRVVDAINQAGGVTPNADTSLLNLSLELEDGMVIVIYSNSEIANYEKTKETETKKAKLCTTDVKNDACISNSNTNVANNFQAESANSKNNSEIKSSTSKINLNEATLEELITLPKIGESKAKAIIEYRTKNGKFQNISEIKNVSGIGDSTFEALKDYITV